MKHKMALVLVITTSLVVTGAVLTFGQEQTVESETQWLWGEVSSIDIQRNELLVQYLDYDTDQEKEVNISVDDKTTYENVDSLLDIKPHDAVSIDYVVFSDGKNVAKNISVEKPEVAPQPTGGQ